MAKQSQTHGGGSHHDPAKQEALTAGVPSAQADDVAALKPAAQAAGLDWWKVIEAIAEAAQDAPAVVAFLKKILGK